MTCSVLLDMIDPYLMTVDNLSGRIRKKGSEEEINQK